MTTSKFQSMKELRAEMVGVARGKIKAPLMQTSPLLNLWKQKNKTNPFQLAYHTSRVAVN